MSIERRTLFGLSRVLSIPGKLAGASLAATLAVVGCAASQPNLGRPVTVVVPFAAGGPPDIIARNLTEHVARRLGTPMIVDNRGGGGGNIGGQFVASANPDGQTLLVCAFSCSIEPSLYAKPAYDARKLAPVVMLGTVPSVMLVPASLPVHSFQEFVAYAKKNPVSYGSGGVGSSPHLIGELLAQSTGIDMVHVPYRSVAQVAPDLLSGRVQLLFDNLPTALPNIKSGKVRALLVAQKERAAAAPEVPTSAEAGMPELLISPWFGVFAPAGTPIPVLERLNGAFNEALKDAVVQQRLQELGVQIAGGSRQALAAFLLEDVKKWGVVIRERRISAN